LINNLEYLTLLVSVDFNEIKIETVWHLKRRRERKEKKGRKRPSQKITI
jgi:hypothetical protein